MASPNVLPAPASAPDEESSFSVYGVSDPNFVNYAELYKSPPELKTKSQDLIDFYAKALITGKDDKLVYPDSPNLVGNRYFINTGAKCMGDDNAVHTRSLLVDNVLTSTMNDAVGENKGLMYSVLASMKTINSDSLFANSTDGKPTKNTKYSPTGYLSNISMEDNLPSCKKITVYTTSKNDSDSASTSGWVVDTDEIDPLAKKEGFTSIVEGFDFPSISGGNPSEFLANARKSDAEIGATASTAISSVNETTDTAIKTANDTLKTGKIEGEAAGKSGAKAASASTLAATSTAKTNMTKSQATARSVGLKSITVKYLQDNPNITTLDILKKILEIKYVCGESHFYRRVPGDAIRNITKGLATAIIKSTDRDLPNLSPGQNIPVEYSITSLFDMISKFVDDNKYYFEKVFNLDTDLPAGLFPKQQITIVTKYKIYYDYFIIRVFKKWGYKDETIPSNDYSRYMSVLNGGAPDDTTTIKYAAARTLLQYQQPQSYGSTPIPNEEGIYAPKPAPVVAPGVTPVATPLVAQTQTKVNQTDEATTAINKKAAFDLIKQITESFDTQTESEIKYHVYSEPIPWFYMISMLFIVLYIVYKFIDRSFDFERLLK
jgi:hypothetical protein